MITQYLYAGGRDREIPPPPSSVLCVSAFRGGKIVFIIEAAIVNSRMTAMKQKMSGDLNRSGWLGWLTVRLLPRAVLKSTSFIGTCLRGWAGGGAERG